MATGPVTVNVTLSEEDRNTGDAHRIVWSQLIGAPDLDNIENYVVLGRKRNETTIDRETGEGSFELERNSDLDTPDSYWKVTIDRAEFFLKLDADTPSEITLGDDAYEVIPAARLYGYPSDPADLTADLRPGPWHTIGGEGEIQYEAGWAATAAAPLRYRIENDLIRFDGSADGGGGSPVVCAFDPAQGPAPVTASAVATVSDGEGGLEPLGVAVFDLGDDKQSLLSFAAADTTTNFASIVLPLIPDE